MPELTAERSACAHAGCVQLHPVGSCSLLFETTAGPFNLKRWQLPTSVMINAICRRRRRQFQPQRSISLAPLSLWEPLAPLQQQGGLAALLAEGFPSSLQEVCSARDLPFHQHKTFFVWIRGVPWQYHSPAHIMSYFFCSWKTADAHPVPIKGWMRGCSAFLGCGSQMPRALPCNDNPKIFLKKTYL